MGRLLALDIGERRIGVAVSDPTGTLARPLTAITRASRLADFEAVERLIEEYAIEQVIVGMPLSLNGTEGPQARQTRRYSDKMAQAISAPVQFWDERYSSKAASEILRKRGKRQNRARGTLDAAAAAVVLQSYLDARAAAGKKTSSSEWTKPCPDL